MDEGWRRRRVGWGAAAIALVPRALATGDFRTVDEVQWMARSQVYSDGLLGLHPSQMSVTARPNILGGALATMPGVPTMVLGSLARGIWRIGVAGGLWDGRSFTTSRSGIVVAQLAVAVASSALIGLVTWLVLRWAGLAPAVLTGLVLATEPFWVTSGAVLHTDELGALFGTAGLVAFALALDVPSPTAGGSSRAMAALAGALLALCALAKVSGLAVVAGAVPISAWALAHTWRGRAPGSLRRVAGVHANAAVAAVVTTLLLWPALLTGPSKEIRRTIDAAHIGSQTGATLFDGRRMAGGTPAYFLHLVPLRLTPWALAVLVVGMVVAVARRAARPRALLLVAAAAPAAVAFSLASQQNDRYALAFLGPLTIAAALSLCHLSTPPSGWARWGRPVLLLASVAVVAHAVVVAPSSFAYFDPLLGGANEMERSYRFEWTPKGAEVLGQVRRLEGGGDRCRTTTVWGVNLFMVRRVPCVRVVLAPEQARYVAIYLGRRQTDPPAVIRALVHGRTKVATMRYLGLDLVEIWRR